LREGKKGWGLWVGPYYTTLNLKVGRHLAPLTCRLEEDPLSQEGEQSQTILTYPVSVLGLNSGLHT
jgi:hypothetical protein